MSGNRGLLIVNTGRWEASLGVRDLGVDDPKDLVHFLKRHTLGLRDEEPGEKEHRETETPVDEVCTVSTLTNSSHHIRGSASNDEVEQPLGSSGQRDIGGSQTSSWDLRNIDPTNRSPPKLEKGCEQKDHDNSNITSRRHRDTYLRGVEAYVEADVKHRSSLGDGGPEKRFTTTQGIGNEEEENRAGNHLHDPVDTGGEETSFSAAETKVFLPINQFCVFFFRHQRGYLRRSGEHSS